MRRTIKMVEVFLSQILKPIHRALRLIIFVLAVVCMGAVFLPLWVFNSLPSALLGFLTGYGLWFLGVPPGFAVIAGFFVFAVNLSHEIIKWSEWEEMSGHERHKTLVMGGSPGTMLFGKLKMALSFSDDKEISR